jgi:hypothetical protein
LRKLNLFRSSLLSLRVEWNCFADQFLRKRHRGFSLTIARLGSRAAVIARSVRNIRHGLNVAGYSAEQLNVELLSDHDGAETCHEPFGMTRDSHARKDRLTVCCALARLEGFAQGRALELLRYPGAGAFHSLCAESDQLTGVACSVRRWLPLEGNRCRQG